VVRTYRRAVGLRTRHEPDFDASARLRALLGVAAPLPAGSAMDPVRGGEPAAPPVVEPAPASAPRPTPADAPRPTPAAVPASAVFAGAGLGGDWRGRALDALRGARAMVAIAVVAASLGGVLVWRARPVPLAVPPAPVGSAGPGAAGTSAGGELVIDVAGAVRKPGLVRLPLGSRVADAIAAAGGLAPRATTAGLNLARKLADGEQVYVLPPGAAAAGGPAAGSAPGGAPTQGKLDLNLATAAQLDALPGVGPVLAERIVAWRTQHGRFASVDQLGEVPGIGEKKLESLRDLVTA
jgi:competence protein ComEA